MDASAGHRTRRCGHEHVSDAQCNERDQEKTTNQIVDSSFTTINAPIDKIDIPTRLPPIVSTLMDIRSPFGGQFSLQSIMRKFELGQPVMKASQI